jgi:hypothetical protein
MIIALKYTNFFLFVYIQLCMNYNSSSVLGFSFLFATPSVFKLCLSEGPYSRCPGDICVSSSVFVKLKAKQTRGGSHGNMATATEHHGRLLRDRKSIPGSRYGSHRDCDSALHRVSGWNSFEYWLRSGSCCCCHHSDWPVLYLELRVHYPDFRKKS